MGELHLDIIYDRLLREYSVDCNRGTPQVAYKETITEKVEYREIYKKQTGGRGKYADILLEVSPGKPENHGLEFINLIKGGSIPAEFIPSIKKRY